MFEERNWFEVHAKVCDRGQNYALLPVGFPFDVSRVQVAQAKTFDCLNQAMASCRHVRSTSVGVSGHYRDRVELIE